MKILFCIAFISALTVSYQAGKKDQNVHELGHVEVVNPKKGCKFVVPRGWHIAENSDGTILFSSSSSKMQPTQVGVPIGLAEMSILSNKEVYNVKTVEEWIRRENARVDYSSTRRTVLNISPEIPKAIKVISFEDDGDADHERITHQSEVYLSLNDQLFAVVLKFRANDSRAQSYEQALQSLLQSLRVAGSDVGPSK